MITVDTSVWIDFFRGVHNRETTALLHFLGQEEMVIGDLVLTELLQGAKSKRDYASMKQALLSFDVVNMVDTKLAVKSAENYRYLREKGVTVRKTIDMLIGTYCIENRIELLHRDKDFTPLVNHLGLKTL